MFITTPDAEVAVMALFGPEGSKQWTYVEFAVAVPWFCVHFWQVEDGIRIGRTFHLTHHVQLSSLVAVRHIEITSVDVVLPSYYTGKEGWTMQPLRAIWRGTTSEGAMQEVYVSRSGRRFAHDEGVLHERDLANRQRIFCWRRPPRAEAGDPPDDSELVGTLML